MEQTEKRKLTAGEAVKMLETAYPHGVDLIYIDYSEQLQPDQVTEIVTTGETMDCFDTMADREWETIKCIIRETFSYDSHEIDDEVEEAIRNWCYEHDTSTPLEDMMRNTPSLPMYYKLGHEMYGCTSQEDDFGRLKKLFKPKSQEDKDKLNCLWQEASYGGEVVIMFNGNVNDFYGDLDHKFMAFTDPTVAIMDRLNGSGYFVDVKGKYRVPMIRSRLRVDETAPGYSLQKVYGGGLRFSDKYDFTSKRKGILLKVEGDDGYSDGEKREMEFECKWREEGKCSYGDTNIERHKGIKYHNEPPLCRNECSECHTRWLD